MWEGNEILFAPCIAQEWTIRSIGNSSGAPACAISYSTLHNQAISMFTLPLYFAAVQMLARLLFKFNKDKFSG